MSEFRESLKEKGFSEVAIDLSKSDMSSVIENYINFLELDESYFDETRYFLTDRGDGDFGQFRRTAGTNSDRGVVLDNKDIFYFGASSRQVLEARLHNKLPNSLRCFYRDAEEIFWTAERAKLDALDELDILHMGLRKVMMDERHLMNDVLRLIAYYPDQNKLAKGHFDRSVCTLAIGESHEGLRIAPGQNGIVCDISEEYMAQLDASLQPVTHINQEAKFMLGAGWNRLDSHLRFGNQEMPLGWHDVIPSDKTVSERVMRWAIVLFANPHLGIDTYSVPSAPETRPYKKLGVLCLK
jgi:hypothetical protein